MLDASIAAAWLIDDEAVQRAFGTLDRVRQEGGLVPPLWHFEIGNALVVAERRKRLPEGGAGARLAALGQLPISTDQTPDLQATIELAIAHGLSLYDATYVELGKRHSLPLATLDRSLAHAAREEGLQVISEA